jgi:hypothetical protein
MIGIHHGPNSRNGRGRDHDNSLAVIAESVAWKKDASSTATANSEAAAIQTAQAHPSNAPTRSEQSSARLPRATTVVLISSVPALTTLQLRKNAGGNLFCWAPLPEPV